MLKQQIEKVAIVAIACQQRIPRASKPVSTYLQSNLDEAPLHLQQVMSDPASKGPQSMPQFWSPGALCSSQVPFS
ncbi:hypothetical protein WJX74_010802 [Apatococcus lobatus]|uniref:Uncharacterized protein n=1 Tax=Apatococcus lobatus TaxID=904363 RepID=A0AAW1RAI1_9CHLO